MNNLHYARTKSLIFIVVIISLFFSLMNLNINAISNNTNDDQIFDVNYDVNREARAVWVSPLVSDISKYSTKSQYQREITSVLDTMEKYNLNVLIFHIRIMNDALYKSTYSDWSVYYNTNPDWEALPWVIEECHNRGIEFHAWMNPYRVTTNTSLSLDSIAKKYPKSNAASNPKNLLKGSGTVILNPGVPEVQSFLLNVVMEVVRNYDVDAIHFDDYFYVEDVDNSNTYGIYGTGQGDEQFRRDSIDILIKSLNREIGLYNKNNNKSVELGISPTAAWNNGDGIVTYDENGYAVSNGSKGITQGHYGDYLYCDTLKWVNEGLIDYIIPQCYIGTSNGNDLFYGTVDWWSKVCKNSRTKLYIGMGLYRASSSGDWSDVNELNKEFKYMDNYDNIQGFSIFSYKHLTTTNTYVKQNLNNANSYFQNNVLAPVIDIDSQENEIENNYFIINEKNIHKIGVKNNLNKYYIILRKVNNEYTLLDAINDKTNNEKIVYTDTYNGDCEYFIAPVLNNNTIGKYYRLSTNDVYNKINFYGYNKELIKYEYYQNDDNIELFTPEDITGYEFITWEKEGNNYFAKYDKKTYKVTFYVNNEVYKTVDVKYGDSIEYPDFDATGGTFSGFKGDVNSITQDTDVYATFIRNEFYIKYFNGNELLKKETYYYGDIVSITETAPADTGFEFIGFIYQGQIVNELVMNTNYNLYAKFDVKHYKVNCNLDGGIAEDLLSEIKYNEEYILPIPVKDGYTFIGWYLNNEKVEKIVNPSDEVIIAKYEPIIYHISYNISDEEKVELNLNDVKYDLLFNEEYNLPTLNKDGFIFLGWFSNNNELYTKVINESVELTPRFVKAEYTINYYLDGGNTEENLKTVIAYDEEYVLPEANKSGYTFIGWFESNDSDVLIKNVKNQDINVYARYQKITYKITYHLDGGECANLINEFSADSEVILETPTKKGYKFIGYFDSENTLVSKLENKDYELFAKWEKSNNGCNEGIISINSLLNSLLIFTFIYIKRRKAK